jgi:small subunit ribosomal protein S27Ae
MKMAKKTKAAKSKLYKVEGDELKRLRPHCPRCGPGVFMAEHGNRLACGKCGYTEFKK